MREQFGSFVASELYCPKCKSSQPVREHLLLVLPSGELHNLVCKRCSTSLGQRTVTGPSLAATRGPIKPRSSPSRRLLV